MHTESIATQIRKAGVKATKQRVQVYGYLVKSRSPVSIQDIANALQGSIDTVTAYRVIDSFKKAGLVREVDLRQGRPLFEVTESDHHHIVCTNCSRIEDFTGCHIDTIAEKALGQSQKFALINSHSLELFGLCKKCVV